MSLLELVAEIEPLALSQDEFWLEASLARLTLFDSSGNGEDGADSGLW